MTVKQLQKRYTRTVKSGDGWVTYLQIDQQGFCVVDRTTKARAIWYAKMLAIALHRMISEVKR
jgi:hypothetical protein